MSFHSLNRRLQALQNSYRQTLTLIQDLQKFPTSPTPTIPDPDEARVELATEIHETLKDHEDALDLLRQEVDEEAIPSSRYHEYREEKERNTATIARLNEDIRNARAAFRRAQLQAKRNADTAKRKEREQLFANRATAARPGDQKRLTQDELALNAAEDVTRALRRTHDLLQGNLSQSQFAQQALEESQDALRGLGQNYGGTGDLLKNSRGLARQLIKSNKSDTWYLRTSFLLLAVTIAWLVFRRLIYGPSYWLIWFPIKLVWWTLAGLGGMLVGKEESVAVSPSVSIRTATGAFPKNPEMPVSASMEVPAKGAGWGQRYEPPSEDSMIENIGRAMEDMQEPIPVEDDATDPKDVPRPDQARNTKKRMWEVDIESEQARIRDEL